MLLQRQHKLIHYLNTHSFLNTVSLHPFVIWEVHSGSGKKSNATQTSHTPSQYLCPLTSPFHFFLSLSLTTFNSPPTICQHFTLPLPLSSFPSHTSILLYLCSCGFLNHLLNSHRFNCRTFRFFLYVAPVDIKYTAPSAPSFPL